MTVVSKLIGSAGGYTGTYNCYELTHPWTPSCNRVVVDMFMSGIRFSLKTYLPLYLVGARICGEQPCLGLNITTWPKTVHSRLAPIHDRTHPFRTVVGDEQCLHVGSDLSDQVIFNDL